jgi:hypothetical protein
LSSEVFDNEPWEGSSTTENVRGSSSISVAFNIILTGVFLLVITVWLDAIGRLFDKEGGLTVIDISAVLLSAFPSLA